MVPRFDPPPGWDLPPGFDPPEGWQPHPAWPRAPHGWTFWVDDAGPDDAPSGPPRDPVAPTASPFLLEHDPLPGTEIEPRLLHRRIARSVLVTAMAAAIAVVTVVGSAPTVVVLFWWGMVPIAAVTAVPALLELRASRQRRRGAVPGGVAPGDAGRRDGSTGQGPRPG